MEKHEYYESKCLQCFYYETCVKNRMFDCDHYLSASDEDSWYGDYIEEDRQIFNNLWNQYVSEYCD